jgi:hypothetical protein
MYLTCSMVNEKFMKSLSESLKGLNPLGTTVPVCKWEDSFEMQLNEVAREGMDWIYPTRDSVQCCVNNAG